MRRKIAILSIVGAMALAGCSGQSAEEANQSPGETKAVRVGPPEQDPQRDLSARSTVRLVAPVPRKGEQPEEEIVARVVEDSASRLVVEANTTVKGWLLFSVVCRGEQKYTVMVNRTKTTPVCGRGHFVLGGSGDGPREWKLVVEKGNPQQQLRATTTWRSGLDLPKRKAR